MKILQWCIDEDSLVSLMQCTVPVLGPMILLPVPHLTVIYYYNTVLVPVYMKYFDRNYTRRRTVSSWWSIMISYAYWLVPYVYYILSILRNRCRHGAFPPYIALSMILWASQEYSANKQTNGVLRRVVVFVAQYKALYY